MKEIKKLKKLARKLEKYPLMLQTLEETLFDILEDKENKKYHQIKIPNIEEINELENLITKLKNHPQEFRRLQKTLDEIVKRWKGWKKER